MGFLGIALILIFVPYLIDKRNRRRQASKSNCWTVVLSIVGVIFLAGCNRLGVSQYGLPVKLGSSSDDVRKGLGSPDYSYKTPSDDIVEWYYSHGIVAVFERDRLSVVTLPPDVASYKGFLAYSGPIIRGVKLSDKKQKILKALGEPTKIESDDLPSGTDPGVPVVWPKESRYYWRFTEYTVEVDFLNQAQEVSDEKHLTLPVDTVAMISVRK